MTMALEGIKVVDLSRYAPGFAVSMYLADMGADVIRIEEPGVTGRRSEFTETPLAYRTMNDARSAAYNALERNKRKIALNLKDADAREVFYKLVRDADVVLDGSRPGVAKRLGVDYETCRALNPRVIYCAVTGFGQDGPYALRAGHDINYLSHGGALSIFGSRDGAPAFPSNILADFSAGAQNAVIGILTAIIARGRTGKGQMVDISMTDGVIGLLVQSTQEFFMNGLQPKPGKDRLTGGVPHYNVYRCKDGRWIAIGANEPWFFDAVGKIIGRPDLVAHQQDAAKHQEIEAALKAAFLTKTADQWHDLMSRADTCVTKILDFAEVFADPHVRHRKMVLEVTHPQAGKAKQVGFPVKLSETPGTFRKFAGIKGEDTDAVLKSLGYSEAQIKAMREKNAIL